MINTGYAFIVETLSLTFHGGNSPESLLPIVMFPYRRYFYGGTSVYLLDRQGLVIGIMK